MDLHSHVLFKTYFEKCQFHNFFTSQYRGWWSQLPASRCSGTNPAMSPKCPHGGMLWTGHSTTAHPGRLPDVPGCQLHLCLADGVCQQHHIPHKVRHRAAAARLCVRSPHNTLSPQTLHASFVFPEQGILPRTASRQHRRWNEKHTDEKSCHLLIISFVVFVLL